MPAPRFHPFARLLIAVIGAIFVSIAISAVLATATAVAASVAGQDATAQVEKFFRENLLLINLFVYPPTLLWLWFCRRFFDRRAFVSLGLRARGFFAQFAGGTFCGFLAIAFVFAILWLSGNIEVRGLSVAAQSGGTEKIILALLGWSAMMLCVGFFEEVCFRGYAFHNLNIWLGARWANVIQAAVFALIHLGNLAMQKQSTPDATLAAWLAMPNIFLIGIFFGLCYLKTGSLWFPIAFHAAWNFFLGSVFSLPVSGIPIFQLFDVSVGGSTPLTGGAFGPEASLLLTPILLALIFAASRSHDSRQAISDLRSLRKSEDAFEIEEPIRAEIENESEDEARENRFKTKMGKRRGELDDDTRRTLQMLNESSRQTVAAPPQSTPAPSIVVAPVLTAPVEIPVARAPENEAGKIDVAPAWSTPGAPPVAAQTASREAEPIPETPVTPDQTPSTPDAPANPPAAPKPKSVPRW